MVTVGEVVWNYPPLSNPAADIAPARARAPVIPRCILTPRYLAIAVNGDVGFRVEIFDPSGRTVLRRAVSGQRSLSIPTRDPAPSVLLVARVGWRDRTDLPVESVEVETILFRGEWERLAFCSPTVSWISGETKNPSILRHSLIHTTL